MNVQFSESTYQEDMIKDLCRTVHLAQNDNHLLVDELLELSQVARHVHFQLCSNLHNQTHKHTFKKSEYKIWMFGASANTPSEARSHLFAGDILKVFLHHDLPQTGFDLTLCQFSFCRSAETP